LKKIKFGGVEQLLEIISKFRDILRNYPYGEKDNKKLKGLIETDAIAGCASIMRVR
jgi:hypothetical protein